MPLSFSEQNGEKIFFYLLALILLSLPFNMYFSTQWNSIFIILLFLFWVTEGNWTDKWNKIAVNHFFWLFSGLYLVNILGVFYTENTSDAFHEITAKLSLIIFPIVFISTKYHLGFKECKQLMVYFIGSVLLASLINLWSGFELTSDSQSGLLILEQSSILHRPYLGMYIVFIIFILAMLLVKNASNLEERFYVMLIAFFVFFLYIIQARMAMIALVGVLLIMALIWSIINLRWLLLGILIGTVLMVSWFIYPVFDLLSIELSSMDMIDAHMEHPEIMITENPREKIWSCAMDIIEKDNNWMIGTGTGDVQDELSICYEEKRYDFESQYKLNAHNEFLQTTLRNGIVGFFILISNLLIPFLFALRQRWYLYLIFILIFSFCAMSETLLSRQSGVVFYAFFNSFLFFQFYKLRE